MILAIKIAVAFVVEVLVIWALVVWNHNREIHEAKMQIMRRTGKYPERLHFDWRWNGECRQWEDKNT